MTADERPPDATLSIPEIRDFERINAELIQCLDRGARRVVLSGVDGQRLLASRLSGRWDALIEVEGNAGPELAAELDAPGLTVVARGTVADGAGRAFRAGRLVVEGTAGDGLGYTQEGGLILVLGAAGHRAGLMQSGGTLIVLGEVGRLARERQSGGLLILRRGKVGPHEGRGFIGGRRLLVPIAASASSRDHLIIESAIREAGHWLPEGALT